MAIIVYQASGSQNIQPSCCFQDSQDHDGDGVFLYLVRLLTSEQDTSTQGLAADLLHALMDNIPVMVAYSNDALPMEWQTLAHQKDLFDTQALLQLVIVSKNIKVCMQIFVSCHGMTHTCNCKVHVSV